MKDRQTALKRLLVEVFRRANPKSADSDRACTDFVFHMTDWESDLVRVAELYAAPERFSVEEAERIVSGLLYHASDHILRAALLQYDYVPPAARPQEPASENPVSPAQDRR